MKPAHFLFMTSLFTSFTIQAGPIPASQDGLLGLYPANNMQLLNCALSARECQQAPAIAQALWYFQQESIAVAGPGQPVSGYSRTDNAQQDTQRWATAIPQQDLTAWPPLIWLGSSQVIPLARLIKENKQLLLQDGKQMEFAITPKIATNLSYFDNSSMQFFSQRDIRLRGETSKSAEGHEQFTARTLWPLDFRITPSASATVQPLSAEDTLQKLVRAHNGGAQHPFYTRLLWQSAQETSRQDWAGKAVLGVILNGAQGDDDEAHGGHFGIVSGRMEADGNWSRWLVNNFYNLDAYSEKGIVAAVTPMDKYLMDLNNGQSFYRPSYMLVAVLKSETVPRQYQSAINRVFNHFYRHDFHYQHANANCAGISIDTLRALGWHVLERGKGGLLKATAAYWYVAATSRSLHDARNIYDYITTEDTRLNPAAAFDAIGYDMLGLAHAQDDGQAARPFSQIEQQFADDVIALIYVHIPQIPSSRAYGQAPVYSFDEYLRRAPADRSAWKIIPVEARPFPAALRDGLALEQQKTQLMPWPVALLSLSILLVLVLAWPFYRYLKQH